MRSCLFLMLAVLVLPSPADAQRRRRRQQEETPPAQTDTAQSDTAQSESDERARAHFQSGSQYFDTGDYDSAIREFRAAYELSHRAPLLFNIYMAYERLGDFPHAAEYLDRYLRDSEEVPNRESLQERLTRLRERAAEGDGTPAPTSGPDLMVPAIVSFSAGGLGLVMFALFGGLALAEDGALSASCGAAADRSCTSEQVSGLVAFTVLADIGWVLALVGAGLGTTFFLLNGGGTSAPEQNATLVPWVSPYGGGLSYGARW